MRALRATSLRSQLLAGFALIVTLTVSGTLIASTAATRQQLITHSLERLEGQARTHAQLIGTQLDGELVGLESFSLSEVVQDRVAAIDATLPTDEGQARQKAKELDSRWSSLPQSAPEVAQTLTDVAASELLEYQSLHPECLIVLATDRAGGVVAATARTPRAFYGAESWWRAVAASPTRSQMISQPVRDDQSGQPVVWIAVPLYGHGTQTPIGVLAAAVRVDQLATQVAHTAVGASGRVRIRLSRSQLLGPDGMPTDLDDDHQLALADLSAEPMAPQTIDDVARFGVQVPIATSPATERLGWRVLVDQEAREVLGVVDAMAWSGLTIGVVALVAALLLATVIASLISAPLHAVAQAAARIAGGDLSQRLVARGAREIRQLAQSFNAMAVAIEARITAERTATVERAQLQEQIIHGQEALLRELSTPLIPLSRNLLLLPLIGSVDSRRAEQVVSALLAGVAEHHAETVVLDLTGVVLVDTHVGQVLLRAAQGVRLLGASVVLVGIRAEVAQTMVRLGIDLSAFHVYGTLQSAMTDLVETVTISG